MSANVGCYLCGKEVKLVLSHILPEGFYRPIYDSKRANFYSLSRLKSSKIQQGFKQYLLCKYCDNEVIGVYDNYAIEIIRDKRHVGFVEGKGVHEWSDIDVKKLKAFFLSLLWRAHIATIIPYEQVQLDEKYIERIKSYIQDYSVIPDDFFPIFAFALINPEEGSICDQIVTPIHTFRLSKCSDEKMYGLIFAGFCWHILGSESINRHPQQAFFLSPQGGMISPRINMYDNELFMRAYKSMISMRGKS